MFPVSKYPKNILVHFENRSTGHKNYDTIIMKRPSVRHSFDVAVTSMMTQVGCYTLLWVVERVHTKIIHKKLKYYDHIQLVFQE